MLDNRFVCMALCDGGDRLVNGSRMKDILMDSLLFIENEIYHVMGRGYRCVNSKGPFSKFKRVNRSQLRHHRE